MKSIQKTVCKDRRSGRDRRKIDENMLIRVDKRSFKDRRSGIERRKSTRFQVKDFIFIKLWSESEEDIGQLLDVSKEGLSYRYFSNDKKPRSFSELSICSSGGKMAVSGIPFKEITDTYFDDSTPFNSIIFRRSGVQFGHLTSNQKAELIDLFGNWGTGQSQ